MSLLLNSYFMMEIIASPNKNIYKWLKYVQPAAPIVAISTITIKKVECN